ncbi:MAG: histidine kinase dimerization/phospho-acceptor domain-containing protein [Rhodospirillaceae bacterium]
MLREEGPSVLVHAIGDKVYERHQSAMPEGGIISVVTDVTEVKKTEQSLMLAKSEAEKANNAKSQFLANMSHDLRTPLNSIIGFSNMLGHQVHGPIDNAHYREYAEHIWTSGQYLLSLFNDILDLSRVESGGYELDENLLDIEEELMSSRGRCAPAQIDAPGARRIEVEVAHGAPMLLADRRAITQIVDNLTTNAIKHAGRGSRIAAKWYVDAQGDGVLSIEDDGVGIENGLLDDVIEPFVRGNAAAAGPFVAKRGGSGGVGLGLHIVKRLADLHEANMEIAAPSAGEPSFPSNSRTAVCTPTETAGGV